MVMLGDKLPKMVQVSSGATKILKDSPKIIYLGSRVPSTVWPAMGRALAIAVRLVLKK